MGKRKRFLAAALAMTVLGSVVSGCTGESSGGESKGNDQSAKTLNIYCWNESFKDRFEAVYADQIPDDIEVKFTITPNQDNAYQNKLDQDLPNNENLDEKVDIFLVEADYILKYTNADVSLDLIGDVGLTEEDFANYYPYTKDVATDENGKLKAATYEANPGVFVYRRSIAQEVLGTDDPDEVQEYISDWDKFEEVAGKMQEYEYKMLSGYDDSYRTFSNNVSQPWVNENDEIIIDPMIDTWVDQTKDFTEKGYNNKTSLWSAEWNADQGTSGNVFGFFYSTWGVTFTLLGNALETPEEEGGKAEVGNGTFGDWAICKGPADYFWGGTWICVANGSDNVDLAKDLIYGMTCDKDTMKEITYEFQNFVNNEEAMREVVEEGYTSDLLGGQPHIELFYEAAPGIEMKHLSLYDQGLTESLQSAMGDYFNGEITKDEAVDNFYKSATEKYPNLKRPE